MPRKHRSLTFTITRYYLTFFLLIIASVIAAALVTQTLTRTVTRSFRQLNVDASLLVRPDYEEMDIRDIQKLGGWVEVLQGNVVVDVLGKKQDNKWVYSNDELGRQGRYRMSPVLNFYDDNYYYSSAVFYDTYLNEYLCLIKIPRRNMESGIRGFFNTLNPQLRVERMIFLNLVCVVLLFSLFFVLCVIFYGRITTKKITRPLEAIGQGIARITAGDLSTRMDFQAEREFADIRDALNYMAGRLRSAEEEKRAIQENRKKLIMGISHDLKTPITTVYGYAEALHDGIVQDPDRQKRHLKYIRDKATIMSRLIDDLFKYSSMEGSEYTLNLETEDFAEFLRVLLAESYLDIETKEMQLELDIPEDAVPYRFDGAEMRRALTNILGNAVKYNPPGTTLTVALAVEEGALRLMIGDNGVGIAPELQASVFDEFVRGDSARTNDGGSGLGLAIARRVIEAHGGSIALQSQPGAGAVFTIRLPRNQ